MVRLDTDERRYFVASDLEPLLVPIADLEQDAANARKHGERNLQAIARSFSEFGQLKPVVVDVEARVVLAGNGTVEALRSIGWTHVAAVRSTLDGIRARAFAIADNRTAELAEWDDAVLASQLAEILEIEGDLELVGFDATEMEAMVEPVRPNLTGPADDVPAMEKIAHSQLGDLWILGQHRLLCGDSTKAADVDRLMDGHRAALVSTDPPYLVDYTGERPNDTGKDWTASYREIDIKDADSFFRAVFTNVVRIIEPHAAIYCWHAHKRCGMIQKVWEDLGILDHQQIVWVKPTPVFGLVFWHFRHEPCMMGWVQGSKPAHDGDNSMDMNSVWELGWEDGKSRVVGNEHPTQKPVELFARPMRKHTKPGQVCYEPFSGSGSQLVAGEAEGRRVFAMEISPVFVDVAVRRWQNLTGRQAVHEDGRTWEQVVADRGRDRQEEESGDGQGEGV